MKEANNNEVDLLLRSLARGRKQATRQSRDGEPVSSAHLDADELNSYAEGVVPERARPRYTEHLSGCESCRRTVVNLTQAAGTANRVTTAEQPGAGFWQKMRQLLSPKVLAFAVPALVLTAFIGVGFLALKQRSEPQLVAQKEPSASASPAAQGNTDSQPSSAVQPQPTIRNGTESATTAERPKVESVRDEKQQPGLEGLKTDAAVPKAAPEKDSGQPADTASAAASRPYASEPTTAAAPPPAPVGDAEKSAELAKEERSGRGDQARDKVDVFRAQSDDVQGPNRSRNNTSLPATQKSAGIVGGRGPGGMDKNKKAGEAETRAVMGRQFIREGDAWVDTAYQPSRATVRVTRGSEQFRALVADEPGIGTISEQLNGVVIVVWKNRAYRIQ